MCERPWRSTAAQTPPVSRRKVNATFRAESKLQHGLIRSQFSTFAIPDSVPVFPLLCFRCGAQSRHNRCATAALLGTVVLCPGNELTGHLSAQFYTGLIVHLIVDACPYSRIAGLFAYGPAEVGISWEQISKDFRLCG